MNHTKILTSLLVLALILKASLNANNISASRQTAITKATSACAPAVVGINVTETKVGLTSGYTGNAWIDWFYGPQQRYQQYQIQGGGSGFLISADGYILTNHHVAGSAAKIVVTLPGGTKYDADIVGSDLMSDVCLLKINATNLPFLKFANSAEVLIGEWAIAMGNPFGLFDYNAKPVVTVGVVSNTGVSFVQPAGADYRIYKDMIQTDAAISSGNSGGPLLNANGEVIGMNTVIFTTTHNESGDAGSIGIGFAVPAERIKKVANLLKSNGAVERNLQLGMRLTELDAKTAQYYGLTPTEGMLVLQVDARSAAMNAGIQPGDVIQKINGRTAKAESDLLLELGDATVGNSLTFNILRDKKQLNIKLTIPPKIPENQPRRRY